MFVTLFAKPLIANGTGTMLSNWPGVSTLQ